MTFLRRGEVIEYMRDLHAYVKVKPYGMVQIPASIVQKHADIFELLPPHEESEFSIPGVLDKYVYVDPRLQPMTKKYSGANEEDKLIESGNYFMGKLRDRDASHAARLIKMILRAIKNEFARELAPNQEYYYVPLMTENETLALRTNTGEFEDTVNRLMGNCFPVSEEGKEQAQNWAHDIQPALFYFFKSKY